MRRLFLIERKICMTPQITARSWPVMVRGSVLALAMLAIQAACLQVASAQSTPTVRSDAPDRYVVKKGDTLWDIAERFLEDPWRWPLIWQNNQNIANPHLIFPGDLLVVTGLNNIKIVRLKPKVRRDELDRGIPAIPPNVIAPFLTSPLIIDNGDMDQAGYVLQGVDDEIILGKYDKFYARNIQEADAEGFRVFQIGETLVHPETTEILGIEARHLGDARMLRADEDISKLVVIEANEDIRPGNRILPYDDSAPLPYYEPRGPEQEVNGWILYAPKGVREVGRFDVVIISGGEREGLEPGHVLRAMYHRKNRKDPITGEMFTPPDESSGLMMVFRVFDKVSYALIMEATRSISIGDRYINP